jgi:hypothetical protein
MISTSYPMGFPTKYTTWKGKTFFQIVASIQKNTNNAPSLNVHQLFRPLPLKIYRKEMSNIRDEPFPKNCNSRISVKIFDFDTPGNNIVSRTDKTYYSDNLVNTLDINPTTLSAENGLCNTTETCFLSPQNNARKRCRSSGMIPRKFNINKNNDTYATSTLQYLVSRNRTIKQNEYAYIRKGNSGIVPGPGLAASNVYSPGGLSHCWQPIISIENNNNIFYYVWADGVQYTATIPNGKYDINALNQAFQTVQLKNKTYLVGPSSTNVFLMNFGYDTNTQSVVLYAGVSSQTSCISLGYTAPGLPNMTWAVLPTAGLVNFPVNDPTPAVPNPNYTIGATYFIIPQGTNFSNLIGFPPGLYFGGSSESSFKPEITTNYVPLYYKPNNPEFGVQGAVDASTRLQRLKYNTITTGAQGIRSAYGNAAANALAYGVSDQAYTIKSAEGDKVIYTPVVNPRSGQLCRSQHIYRL